MYDRSAEIYDAIYLWKNYAKEAAKLRRVIQKHKRSPGRDLLDVACGTGSHITYLKNGYSVEGLDVNPQMLRLAKKKHPDIVFRRGEMSSFRLKRRFDIITCLFSAIGHLKTRPRLALAIRNMSRHLKPGGVLIVEPWFTPQQWHWGRLDANFVNQPKLKVARMSISNRKGNLSVLDMHHLVATPKGIDYFVEHLELGLFAKAEYRDAFRDAKLETTYDPEGLMGRGLYIGTLPDAH